MDPKVYPLWSLSGQVLGDNWCWELTLLTYKGFIQQVYTQQSSRLAWRSLTRKWSRDLWFGISLVSWTMQHPLPERPPPIVLADIDSEVLTFHVKAFTIWPLVDFWGGENTLFWRHQRYRFFINNVVAPSGVCVASLHFVGVVAYPTLNPFAFSFLHYSSWHVLP